MKTLDKSSIITAIFKRKGGESEFTKIINEENKSRYIDVFQYLNADENPLIVFFKTDFRWILLTNKRILNRQENINFEIYYEDLQEINLAMLDEFKKAIKDKTKFTMIKIKDKTNREYILNVEEGKPFQGFYQVLHFLIK